MHLLLVIDYFLCYRIQNCESPKVNNVNFRWHTHRDGDLSAGEREDDFQKSSTTFKRSRLMSFSDSEPEENERFVLMLFCIWTHS